MMTSGIEKNTNQSDSDDVATLLEQVRELALELHPRRSLHVTLDSTLDRELGFDSLSRMELLTRLERTFSVSLSEQLLASADTPRDLWLAVQAGKAVAPAATLAQGQIVAHAKTIAPDASQDVPTTVETLPEMLEYHLLRHPKRTHVYLYGEAEEAEIINYAMLADGARLMAAGLQAEGLLPGQSVAIMLPTSRDYLFSFFGILLAGGVPVPIYPPLRPSQLEDHLRRHSKILNNASVVILITLSQAKRVGQLFKGQVESLHKVLLPQQLYDTEGSFKQPVIKAQDTAFLQYTSGSTGQPKGVVLSHANLLANIRAMCEAVQVDSSDVFVSWLPLYHDMGLIGAWLSTLYLGRPLVLMSPLAFLTRPKRWLWAIHQYRATLTAAPNFAYEMCISKVDDSDIEGLDLSSLRMAFNGAEPVSPHTIQRFTERFAAYGFWPQAMAPVYGLAEVAVGLAFPPPGRGPLIDRLERETFTTRGHAVPVSTAVEGALEGALEFVACGQPLPGYQFRIVDEAGREVPERMQGRLEFKGPSATSGYLGNPEASQRLFDGDWLDSGDLAYIAEGDVYLTGRLKDIIIRGGRNIYPHELEQAVGEIDGIRKGCVAVFGSPDPVSATERLIVVAETREQEEATLETLKARILAVSSDILSLAPDEIVLAPPHAVLKTSSGKIRRSAVAELFAAGRIDQRPRALWWQIMRIALATVKSRLYRLRRRSADISYAVYAHFIFWLLAPPVWLLVALLPGAGWRWAVMRQGVRLLFRLWRIPLTVEGIDHLPTQQACVFISNHASYLDGVMLVAALPTKFSFIAKAELDRRFISSKFLRRIGVLFVERFDRKQSIADARHTVEVVKSGRSLVFFPEGTFTRVPGLLPFHMGAFISAAEAGVPVVPVTIRGTRSLLRAGSNFPYRSAVHITVGEPILPQGSDWAAAMKLRDSARAELISHLGEPDLASELVK